MLTRLHFESLLSPLRAALKQTGCIFCGGQGKENFRLKIGPTLEIHAKSPDEREQHHEHGREAYADKFNDSIPMQFSGTTIGQSAIVAEVAEV